MIRNMQIIKYLDIWIAESGEISKSIENDIWFRNKKTRPSDYVKISKSKVTMAMKVSENKRINVTESIWVIWHDPERFFAYSKFYVQFNELIHNDKR